MKLLRVDIKNFRSIKDTTVKLKPSCRVLVGINESGKSNILKALALLDEAGTTTPSDARFPLEDEPPVEEAFVRFVFAFDESEISQIYENVLGKILCKNSEQKIFVKEGSKDIDVKSFCRSRSEGAYRINVLNASKFCSYWSLPKSKYTIEKEWAIPSKTVPADFLIEVQEEQKPLKDFLLVNVNDYPEIPESNLVSATVDDVNRIVGEKVVEVVKSTLPDCVYWTYNEQNLLPASIDLNSFAANPAICMPLKNMFELAGIENIQETITTEQSQPLWAEEFVGKSGQTDNSAYQEYLAGISIHRDFIRAEWRKY